MRKCDDGVVLLHGLGRTSGSMRILAWRLKRAGYRTATLRYASMRTPVEAIADGLASRIGQFANSVPGQLHFVTHSLGGLVVRAILHRNRPDNLGRVVMLAPPNGGSEWADALERLRLARHVLGPCRAHLVTRRAQSDAAALGSVNYPLGILAGNRPIDRLIAPLLIREPHDGKVSVSSTKLEGMADHIVLPVGHPMMPFHPAVAAQVLAFLNDGSFSRSTDAVGRPVTNAV
jgi:pimeloyl-ACP methyl ester carboxylesterase